MIISSVSAVPLMILALTTFGDNARCTTFGDIMLRRYGELETSR